MFHHARLAGLKLASGTDAYELAPLPLGGTWVGYLGGRCCLHRSCPELCEWCGSAAVDPPHPTALMHLDRLSRFGRGIPDQVNTKTALAPGSPMP
jgi:hypothetical protein